MAGYAVGMVWRRVIWAIAAGVFVSAALGVLARAWVLVGTQDAVAWVLPAGGGTC
ncbi:MAG: hypothetical protein ACYSVY_01270 [Planctomycetota bacterium]|jgi:hypothetical protein